MRHTFILVMLVALAFTGVAQAGGPAPAASSANAAPAPATSVSLPDRPSLADIRDFTQVYEIIRQAYVEKIDNKTLMNAAISGMLSELDPHSAWLDAKGMRRLDQETSGTYAGLGVVVTNRDNQLVVVAPIDDTPAARAGLKPGDVIEKINGVTVDPQDVQASIDQLRGKAGTKVTLTLRHAGADTPVTVAITRAMIRITSVKLRELQPGYLYIRISEFQSNTARELNHELAEFIHKHKMPKGAILDLRTNPGGLVSAAAGVADTFLNSGVIVSMRGRIKDSDVTFSAHPGDMLDGAPMVVLVNHGTASAAEIVTGALKDHHRALVMGRRTFGKGVVQTIIPVGKEHALKLTTARYYTPNGTSIQAEGITPDITIPDLVAHADNAPAALINAESDLPHHLANQNPGNVETSLAHATTQLDDMSQLARDDYALAQALSVLKGMVLSRQAHAAPAAGGSVPAPASSAP